MAGGDAGGIAGAARLLEEHGGAIEADLQRYYGLHVGDFPWPLTARRLLTLTEYLPDDSALQQALTPEDRQLWTFDRQLAATIIDELRNVSYVQAAVAGAKVKPPKPIPRPGVTAEKPKRPVDRAATAEALAKRGITIPDELKGG